MQKLPPFFAITSLRPDYGVSPEGKHFFIGDYDGRKPGLSTLGAWVVLTSPNSYHVLNFKLNITLDELIGLQRLSGCDPSFIRATESHRFAQVSLEGLLLQKGIQPYFRLRFVYVAT